MNIFKKFKEFRQYQKQSSMTLEELLLQAGLNKDNITKKEALNIPSVAACVEIISNTVAMLPINLYKCTYEKVDSVDDPRVFLLNDTTGDTLDSFQFKKAIVEDFLINGNAYIYKNRQRNNIKSLHYVDEISVSINKNSDPIFKTFDILVNGATYKEHEFIKILRKTKDGADGVGILEENKDILAVAYNSLIYENVLVKTGGNKKGFIQAQSRLSKEAIEQLKEQWNNMYKNNTENCVVLNNGLDFKEASNTSVEMQLNENKKTNSNEICKIFNVAPSILEGKASETEYNNFIKIAILPILKAIETALNKDLLLPSEQGSFYFAFDTKELLKGDIEKRFKAYAIATKEGFMQIDEVRYLEDLRPLGLDFIKLGLQDVLYNPETKEIYTPNTNKSTNINNLDDNLKGGEDDENRNKE